MLAIDVGNTETAIGLFTNGDLIRHWRIQTKKKSTSDELKSQIHSIFAVDKLDFHDVKTVAISSVVPSLTRNYEQLFADCKIVVASYRCNVNFDIALEHPEEIGADRLVNAMAAKEFYGTPFIIVDAGTATTFCVMDAKHRYLGGAIAPGLTLGANALFHTASRLSHIDLDPPANVVGDSTKSALQSGLLIGHAAMVDEMIRRIKNELNVANFHVIGTGGLISLFAKHTTEIRTVDEQLTLKGLELLARSNS